MSWVLVIEPHEESAKLINEVLLELDPNLKTLRFNDAPGLTHWLTQLESFDKEALKKVPEGDLKSIIPSADKWSAKDILFFENLRTILERCRLTSEPKNISMILTGHSVADVQKKRFHKPWIDNLLTKPFDRLTLKQMLAINLNPGKKTPVSFIHRFKTDLTIEMLKEIHLSEMTEIGFQTVSDQNVEIGRIAKYYADFLATNQHRSALARAVKVTPITGSKTFHVELGFFALDQQQSFNLQKMIQARKRTRPLPHKSGDTGSHEFVFLEADKSDLCAQVSPSIDRFMDHPITTIQKIEDLAGHYKTFESRKIKPHVILFIDSTLFYGKEIEECQAIAAAHKDLSVFLLSKQIFPEEKEYELSQVSADIFYSPFNRSYIIKTLKRKWPNLRTKEEIYEAHDQMDRPMFASNPVKIVEVSEAGLIMEYYRPLAIGEFREFVFWMPVEVGIPEIPARCTFAEPSQKGVYQCHFTFFGVEDHHLKHLRKWMLHNYIEQKSEGKS